MFEEMKKIVFQNFEEKYTKEINKPLEVSIMGLTGAGKSSLLNLLFDTNLKTDAIKPCTKKIESISIGEPGKELMFNDMPGIGESEEADETYIEEYVKKMHSSDVVIWAISADNRSTTFDLKSLEYILSKFDKNGRERTVSKIVFILTKTDLIHPDPWILGYKDDIAVFAPGPETKKILELKSRFFEEKFLQPIEGEILCETFNDCEFKIKDEQFNFDKYHVFYKGLITKEKKKTLTLKYPKYEKIFDRLHLNYKVIPCSSYFRYNINSVLEAVVNRLGFYGLQRFKKFYKTENLEKLLLKEAVKRRNIILYSIEEQNIMFDLVNFKF